MGGKPDKDTVEHLAELNKYFNKASEWRFEAKPDPKTDLVGDLFARYMSDLEHRHRVSLENKDTICGLLRKSVDYNCLNEQIDEVEAKTLALIKKAKEREEEVKVAKALRDQVKKSTRVIENKLDFKKKATFKRSNSFEVELEGFANYKD